MHTHKYLGRVTSVWVKGAERLLTLSVRTERHFFKWTKVSLVTLTSHYNTTAATAWNNQAGTKCSE